MTGSSELSWWNKQVPSFFEEFAGKPEKNVSQWFLLSNPQAMIYTIVGYLLFLYFGTLLMRDRKPFDLKYPLVAHNYAQITLSLYMMKEALFSYFEAKPVDGVTSPFCIVYDRTDLRLASVCWLFYASKYVDLLDSVFMVLKKKTEQLSFLHVYHHSLMIFNWYLAMQYLPGGQMYFSVFLNAFVHAIMYSYYLLAALGPSLQKYLWWKKYLTQIQLIQFGTIITQITHGYFVGCGQPLWMTLHSISFLFSLVALFSLFYNKQYTKNRTKTSKSN